MRAIWKYPLEVTDRQIVGMPAATILHVAVQHAVPCLWAEVTPGELEEDRIICIAGTGHPLPDGNRKYLGTFQLMGGGLVYHVFEITT